MLTELGGSQVEAQRCSLSLDIGDHLRFFLRLPKRNLGSALHEGVCVDGVTKCQTSQQGFHCSFPAQLSHDSHGVFVGRGIRPSPAGAWMTSLSWG